MKICRRMIAILVVAVFYYSCVFSIYAQTELNGRYWNKSPIKYYVSATVTSNYGSTVYYRLVNGILAWSGLSNLYITSGTTSDNDIELYMSNYGATGWAGLNSPDSYNSTTGVMAHSTISINTYYYLQNYSNVTTLPDYWRALACHETGHAIGLSHNSTSGESSIMKSNVNNFYSLSSTSPRLISPQTADKNALIDIYGS